MAREKNMVNHLKAAKRVILGLTGLYIILTLAAPFVWAGAPFGEMIPKGMRWIRYYDVYTSTKKRFDKDGNKSSYPDAYERAQTMDIAYGITNDLFIGCSIPYYQAILKGPATRRSEGLGNIKVGGQYRYYKTDALGLAFRFAVKLPTGEPDDPNNTDDMARGSEETTLEFYQFADWYLADKKYIISAQARFNWRLEEEYNQKLSLQAAKGETYKKDPGDEVWLAVGFQRNDFITPGLAPSLRFEARWHGEDAYKSNDQAWDDSKHNNSGTELYFVQPEIQYSLYKKHKIPLRVYVNYRIPLQGRNTYVTERIETGVDLFF